MAKTGMERLTSLCHDCGVNNGTIERKVNNNKSYMLCRKCYEARYPRHKDGPEDNPLPAILDFEEDT